MAGVQNPYFLAHFRMATDLFDGASKDVKRLHKQSKKETRLRKRREWKRANPTKGDK